MNRLTLDNRGLVRISGAEARHLLQDVITCDLEQLDRGTARQAALLTPQGKILFDFLVSGEGEAGFLVDIEKSQMESFIKRMTLYRLRARVDIAPVPDLSVTAVWDSTEASDCVADERFVQRTDVYRCYEKPGEDTATEAEYDRLRIDAGVPEGGRDFPFGDAFPHDAMMDLNRGVSFSKGCFVGQEVVSRMQHRGTARRRIARVTSSVALPETGTAIVSGGKPVGTLGTVAGTSGLAMVRIDRVNKALENAADLTAADALLQIAMPEWSGISFGPDTSDAPREQA